jgi:hypothetical protein
MAVLDLPRLKAQLSFTDDVGSEDDALLDSLALAAEGHIERLLGYRMEETFPDVVPEPLVEACAQLAAWWYLQRETATLDERPVEVPFGVREIVAEFREYTF